VQSPDYTMEQIVEVARSLREDHGFRGYIHLKTIPDAAPDLLQRAGRYADRLSINIELPTERSLSALAPEKDGAAIRRSMARLRVHIDENRGQAQDDARRPVASLPGAKPARAAGESFAAAGQSTQVIVGADATDDATILSTSAQLYGAYRLKRVYYSAFSPIPDAASALPLQAPPLLREHRLYQADWLMRYYGFEAREIVPPQGGMLRLEVDPKLAWAQAHPERFPVDLNRAPRELLLRVPGLGVKAVDRILLARRVRRLRADDLKRLHVPVRKVLPFVLLADHRPARAPVAAPATAPVPVQPALF
jgi:putative DNA modification/repair radical SAM protein